MDMADLIVRTDGPLVVLLFGIAIYLTRTVIAETLDGTCGRPLQLLGLFAAMTWAEGLGRLLALIRRGAAMNGVDSLWMLDSWLRFGLNLLPAAVGVGLLVWLLAMNWSWRHAAWLGMIALGLAALWVWPAIILWVAYELYLVIAPLMGHGG